MNTCKDCKQGYSIEPGISAAYPDHIELCRLHSAAPELLEACNRYETAHRWNAEKGNGHSTEEEMRAWLDIRAAISKAEGRA